MLSVDAQKIESINRIHSMITKVRLFGVTTIIVESRIFAFYVKTVGNRSLTSLYFIFLWYEPAKLGRSFPTRLRTLLYEKNARHFMHSRIGVTWNSRMNGVAFFIFSAPLSSHDGSKFCLFTRKISFHFYDRKDGPKHYRIVS
jgi:hypothetical protein